RSLQIHFDTRIRTRDELLAWLMACESRLPALDDMNIPSRIIHLPLSWDDPATQIAIEKYNRVVRPAAPWYPSNIEFIRRINGLDHIDDVKQIVFDASYLVMGLGDVYLGAPVATPLDPRHRLVTTKYNPARTWTPENAVGIGGAYLCIYGMEGPGGYQLVGRTLQMWNRYRQTAAFKTHRPWLLRYFDQIRFYPVSEAELLKHRADFIAGRLKLRIEESTLNLKQYNAFLQQHRESIESFKTQQQKAFDEESQRWKATAAFETVNEDILEAADAQIEIDLPAGAEIITAPVSGTVWKLLIEAGQQINQQEPILVIESMKMEFPVPAPADGVVVQLFCQPGNYVAAGQALGVLQHSC
ncbi:MAG TPA: carboxyltransferase domain-containing protein, partial [Nitrosomonas sp.]|nr:carboxyltransferase domain-containing protein [Nitrosomonas sp.]